MKYFLIYYLMLFIQMEYNILLQLMSMINEQLLALVAFFFFEILNLRKCLKC